MAINMNTSKFDSTRIELKIETELQPSLMQTMINNVILIVKNTRKQS